MIRSTTFLLILLTLSGFSERPGGLVRKSEKIREFTIVENDTTSYTLKLAFDERDQPAYFFRNVFTPVCLTGECKPVYINFYWDLLGNYTRYDLPPGEVLTKMDHREFKQEDYDKLRDILDNTNSLLKDVAMEDLVGKGTENLADSVDAKAGATLKTVKNEVIDGAVYTCYTLWHIAHGKVADEMQKITESYRTDDLLHRFLTSSNYHYQYWAMDKVVDKAGSITESFTPDMLQIIRGKNVFTARAALQKISNPFFASNARQVWLWETYQSTSYPLQIAILKKLAQIPFQPSLAEATAKAMVNANREQFTLMINLLASQPKLSEKALLTMANQLDTSNQEYATEINRVLTSFHPKKPAVLAKMNAFKNKR
ncbi:hypothetical protein [Spirosoma foliorum]|uniref:Uncharacterized protein n=1 Tax=Spirosoma foliorum TaxID=2710596 RepID=A0A7G5GTP5_9BACT|nr:hypothetical protein [Spirosoma foliorum]QMW02237.1 hypothetical protein H3H32_30645 [Spirosoma foliorum]